MDAAPTPATPAGPADRRVLLKIKLKSLAAEARIIRREELRTPGGALRNEMANHRRHELRGEARATALAYGFLRGQAYAGLEPAPRTQPRWHRVQAMIHRYGTAADRARWEAEPRWWQPQEAEPTGDDPVPAAIAFAVETRPVHGGIGGGSGLTTTYSATFRGNSILCGLFDLLAGR